MREKNRPLGKADLHIHTAIGDGLPPLDELLEWVQVRTDLDVIAITDHDTIEGGLEARELAQRAGYRFDVVVGAEVTSLGGHMLALFLERPVHSYRSVAETMAEIHAQGGICVVPHPLSWLTLSVGERGLNQLVSDSDRPLDALETANGTVAGRVVERRVRELNRTRYRLAETGGSDAHFLTQVGASYTTFPGRTVTDLRTAIAARTSRGVRATANSAVPARDLARQQVRSLIVHPCRKVWRGVGAMLEGR